MLTCQVQIVFSDGKQLYSWTSKDRLDDVLSNGNRDRSNIAVGGDLIIFLVYGASAIARVHDTLQLAKVIFVTHVICIQKTFHES